MIMIAKKYLFRLVMLSLAIYVGYHWVTTYPKDRPKKAGEIFSFAANDVSLHWGGFKETVSDFQRSLVKGIDNEAQIRRGGMNRLSHALDLYKAENERYPEKIDGISSWYKDYNEITKDQSFKYEPSSDGKHFKISILISNGDVYTVER